VSPEGAKEVMAHTLTNLLTHIIFSTKDRRATIGPEIRPGLHAYMGGIIREVDGTALAIGGTGDHVHILASLPPALALADALRLIKANSSRWMHEKAGRRLFSWQAGYSAFSVSRSNATRVIHYIQQQERHHRRMPFKEELIRFLKVHGLEFNERYLWE
jgi:REP element-mobilizing transposase RayT